MGSLLKKIAKKMIRRGMVAPVASDGCSRGMAVKVDTVPTPKAKESGVYLTTPDGVEFGPASSEDKVRKMARETLGLTRLPAGCKVNRI
jgi:hypothetical protein